MSESPEDTTILVVDDDPNLRSVLARFLEDRPWLTLVVADGPAALHIVESYPDEIDLLVTDVLLEGMDGFTLAAQVAAERPNIKILYMSGHFSDNHRVRHGLREAGRFFLQKPFGRRVFLDMVENALTRSVDATDAFAVILGNPLLMAQVIADQGDVGSARSARYTMQLPVRYRWKGMTVWQAGQTRNLSRAGLEFDATPPVPDHAPLADTPEIELRLEVPCPGARRAEVTAGGRVTRVGPSSETSLALSVAVAVSRYRTDIRL
jgi:DNA-binding response OmpR family regulator